MNPWQWQSVLIVTTPLRLDIGRLPHSAFLQIQRVHLALCPDGVLQAAWDTSEAEREYPKAQLVGWKPLRDVPFTLPIRFERTDSPQVVTLIPRGAWVLPYDEALYQRYNQLAAQLQALYTAIESNPLNPPHNLSSELPTAAVWQPTAGETWTEFAQRLLTHLEDGCCGFWE
jgi:hypothetical protein